jgi:hypothetical protein
MISGAQAVRKSSVVSSSNPSDGRVTVRRVLGRWARPTTASSSFGYKANAGGPLRWPPVPTDDRWEAASGIVGSSLR